MSPFASRLMIVEGGLLFAAVCATTFGWARPATADWTDLAAILGQAALLAFCCIVAFYYNDLYDFRIVRTFQSFAARFITAIGVTFLLAAGLYALFPTTALAEGPFASSFLIVVGLVLPLRAASYGFMRSRPFLERVLVLGTSPLAKNIIAEMEAQPHLRYVVVGVADDVDPANDLSPVYRLLGPLTHLDKIISEVRPDRVVVALTERRGRLPLRHLLDARVHGVEVEEGLAVYERLTGKLSIESLMPSALIFSGAFHKSYLQLGLRRFVSLTTAALGLVASAPVMLLIAMAIKLDSPGPVLFIQDRTGFGGQTFRLFKFRTMRALSADPCDSVWKRDDETRITRVGRWLRKLRLDELPQFWNILRGEMDLVGPRPEMASNVKTMSAEIPYYTLRHAVRPGVTGWAQIRQGYSVTLEDVSEKMRYDLYYVKNMSLWLDLRILVDTVKIVLFGRGAR